jgi:hypothetical protein
MREQLQHHGARVRKGARSQLSLLAVALLCVPVLGRTQAAGVNQGGPEYLHAPAGMNPLPQHGNDSAAARMEQMREAERRHRLATDAAKLLALSTELKAEIDQQSQSQLSISTLRKAAEAEKVAHELRSYMSY